MVRLFYQFPEGPPQAPQQVSYEFAEASMSFIQLVIYNLKLRQGTMVENLES
jgi:hypothetical protein